VEVLFFIEIVEGAEGMAPAEFLKRDLRVSKFFMKPLVD
jgi:hypothetical protein